MYAEGLPPATVGLVVIAESAYRSQVAAVVNDDFRLADIFRIGRIGAAAIISFTVVLEKTNFNALSSSIEKLGIFCIPFFIYFLHYYYTKIFYKNKIKGVEMSPRPDRREVVNR